MMSRLSSVIILILSVVLPHQSTPGVATKPTPGVATKPTPGVATKTSDVLIVSGGQSEQRLTTGKLLAVDTDYLMYGSFAITSRSPLTEPQDVAVWGQGSTGLSFFELTPLIGVFNDPKDGAALRKMLITKSDGQINTGGDDLRQLEALVKEPGPDKTLNWQREIALQEMKLLKEPNFESLFQRYEKQRAFAQASQIGVKSSQLSELLVDQPANARDDAGWSNVIKLLTEKKLLTPVLHTKVSSAAEPRLICYIRRLPKEGVSKLGGEILVANNNLEPQRIPVALEIEAEESLWMKILASIPTTFVTMLFGLLGTVGGAFVGYRVFLSQQGFLQRIEREKRFSEKKVELSKKIRALFKHRYAGLRDSGDPEIDRVSQIRDALIDEDIYAILLSEDSKRVNDLCDPDYKVEGSRVNELDALLRRAFREFMV